MLAERARAGTLLGRFPTLAEIAGFAAFVAPASKRDDGNHSAGFRYEVDCTGRAGVCPCRSDAGLHDTRGLTPEP
jgi:hypothetical protein